jgi:hypothetical protein
MAEQSSLDPHTASVGFSYEAIGDYPDGDYNVGRSYYWYDPGRDQPAVDDYDFRRQHPEIDDREWQRLFYEAFDRGERDFERGFGQLLGGHATTGEGQTALSLGRIFGPLPPA